MRDASAELAGPLLEARADANPAVLWGGVVARREGDRLEIEEARARAPQAPLTWAWRTAPELPLPRGLGTLALEPDARGPLDLSLLPDELIVRLAPAEASGCVRTCAARAVHSKTLLQEARVPPAARARLPLIFAGSQLLAVADLYSDASVHAGTGAARRARIRWRRA